MLLKNLPDTGAEVLDPDSSYEPNDDVDPDVDPGIDDDVPAAPAKPAAPAVTADDFAALKAEQAELKRNSAALEVKISEANENTQYWFQKAQGAVAKPDAPAAEPVDLVELINDKGEAGFKAWLKDQGLVNKSEVEQLVNDRATQLVEDGKLEGQYPELRNEDSAFMKETVKQYRNLEGVSGPLRTRLAAQNAELALRQRGAWDEAEPATGPSSSEAQRRARVAAQNGSTGKGTPASAELENDALDKEQKMIAAKMGVSEDAYRKRAVKGVVMSSRHRSVAAIAADSD